MLEETGLEVIFVEGEASKIKTTKEAGGFSIECLRPSAVYQTLNGPVDSMGVYFKCRAKGILKDAGDCTLKAKWIDINELKALVNNNQQLFSEIDLAGILFYLANS